MMISIKRIVHTFLAVIVSIALALGISVIILIALIANVYAGTYDKDGWLKPRF